MRHSYLRAYTNKSGILNRSENNSGNESALARIDRYSNCKTAIALDPNPSSRQATRGV